MRPDWPRPGPQYKQTNKGCSDRPTEGEGGFRRFPVQPEETRALPGPAAWDPPESAAQPFSHRLRMKSYLKGQAVAPFLRAMRSINRKIRALIGQNIGLDGITLGCIKALFMTKVLQNPRGRPKSGSAKPRLKLWLRGLRSIENIANNLTPPPHVVGEVRGYVGGGMTVSSEIPGPSDSGLTALVMLLRFHGVGADPCTNTAPVRGPNTIGTAEMVRCAREFGLKARELKTNWERLAKTPSGRPSRCSRTAAFSCWARLATIRSSCNRRKTPRPELMTRADLEAIWDGRLPVLMTRRANLAELSRHFDVTWFLGAIHKYRHQRCGRGAGRVFLPSAVCSCFAIILSGGYRQGYGPSQHPVHARCAGDWTARHRAFETILGILRTYLFSHATNRIDVELGARLFQHLLALPTSYFQTRRVGDSVARVRELENIRTFLTSSALTLVIDLFFTFVFLGVMFIYSPLLTLVVLAGFPFYVGISAGATPAVSPTSRREVQARCRKPGISGGKRHWR